MARRIWGGALLGRGVAWRRTENNLVLKYGIMGCKRAGRAGQARAPRGRGEGTG